MSAELAGRAPYTDAGARQRKVVAGALLLGLLLAGAAIPFVPPVLALVGAAAIALVIAVVAHPPLAAYALIGITPLVAGIDRGRLIPVLRPAEALALALGAALIIRGLFRLRTGQVPRLRLTRVDVSILLLAFTSSVLPLAWMAARRVAMTQDDLLYALMIWKYYGVFLIVRCSVRTPAEVGRCLWVSMGSAAIVAVIAILQSMKLFGVPRLLSSLYTAYGDTSVLTNNRGGATLSLPIAVADLMILNLAIAVGLLLRSDARRVLLLGATGLFVTGVLASGQISAFIALVLALVTLAILTGRARILAAFVPGALLAGILLRPVVQERLLGFQTASGLPVSWQGRWSNLTNYFWPSLFSHYHFLLGVRVSARVSASAIATGYIWIESGYTWLLWAGGIPLLGAFLYFLWVQFSSAVPLSRGEDAVAVAGLAVATGLVVVAVLMTIDPHLTYRGSADLLFALCALTGVARSPVRTVTASSPVHAMTSRTPSSPR
jgi:hypothetical protein